MCTLALYFQVFPDYPLVVAANRDESLNRPSAPPLLLQETPWIFGGKDLLAGGTWLGVNQSGLVAGLLNRHTPEPPDSYRRSRGLLCLDALGSTTAHAAVRFVQAEPAARYNPFNLLVADANDAYVVHTVADTGHVQKLEPGVHLLTNLNLNDPQCPRIAKSFQHFQQVQQMMMGQLTDISFSLSTLFHRLHALLSDHATPLDPRSTDPRNGLCIHLDGYGTCSSSLLAYSASQRHYIYQFAPGPPCQNTYTDVPLPPAHLANQPPSTP